MKRTFRVVTEKRFCQETGRPPCHNKPFGYVIQITPPIVSFWKTDDVEGIGLVHLNPPKRREQHTTGWYKYKADALRWVVEVRTLAHLQRDDELAPVTGNIFGYAAGWIKTT